MNYKFYRGKAFGILTLQKDQICSVPRLFLSFLNTPKRHFVPVNGSFCPFWMLQKNNLLRSTAPFVLLTASKGHFVSVHGSFCPFDCFVTTEKSHFFM
ncbi:hypothetical protein CAY57_13830 [Heyndrickxia coagulans]|nr:hypothetical protein CAY57_13830 [Heyndrickxia coagulans]